MVLFYLFLFLTIASLVAFILGVIFENELLSACITIPFIVCGLITIGLGCDGSEKDRLKDEGKMERRYELVLARIEAYDTDVDFRLLDELYKECVDIDGTIENNRLLYTSPWRGSLYSEKIAHMEKITPIFEEKFNKKN